MAVTITYKFARTMFPFFCILCFHALFSHAANSAITEGQLIRDGETLVSDGLNFEVGFFSLNNSSSSRYVGIWYHNVPSSAYIWVANREKPVQGRGGAITINSDGNLVVLDGEKNQVWSSNVSTRMNNSKAVLDDDGNLVLSSRNGSEVLWQSFDDPTDTFVPGMKVPVGAGKRSYPGFTSWKSATDP